MEGAVTWHGNGLEYMKPDWWDEGCAWLAVQCPVQKRLIEMYPHEQMGHEGSAFHTLARSIVGQQISVKAADAVWGRFAALMERMVPERVEELCDEQLRGCGLSASKVVYMRAIAEGFLHGTLTPEHWAQMSDAEVQKQLVAIKGIGVWTAEMFLIFHLHRSDIWPLGDIGLVKGLERLYFAGEKQTKPVLEALGETWRPYRSLVTWYVWRSLDPVAVQY